MSVFRDGKKWQVSFYYTDWKGKRKRKHKRGFETKRAAEAYEREFLQERQGDLTMRFDSFVDLYFKDMEKRLKYNTILSKQHIFDTKLLPYFRDKEMNSITASDIRKWQGEMLKKNYTQTYLKLISSQLSSLFNYAERYYRLSDNPCKRAGNIGKGTAEEQKFWTLDEFNQFITAFDDRPMERVAFQILFWTGIRLGELLALSYSDIDYENGMIHITKSYQRLKGVDTITTPKTAESIRDVTVPNFLLQDLEDFCNTLYGILPEERMFCHTKYWLERELLYGVKKSGVKRIRIHDLRHSHIALLGELGYSLKEAASRAGHVRITTTAKYMHLYPDSQKNMAKRLDEEYRRSKEGGGDE